jgi:hypothetical protein
VTAAAWWPWLSACAAGLLGAWLLFVFFLAVMALQATRDRGGLQGCGKTLGYSVLFVGWTLDFIVNVAVASLVFFEAPKELTVSARVLRHVKDAGGWRRTVASWLQANLLAPFDPSGRHG